MLTLTRNLHWAKLEDFIAFHSCCKNEQYSCVYNCVIYFWQQSFSSWLWGCKLETLDTRCRKSTVPLCLVTVTDVKFNYLQSWIFAVVLFCNCVVSWSCSNLWISRLPLALHLTNTRAGAIAEWSKAPVLNNSASSFAGYLNRKCILWVFSIWMKRLKNYSHHCSRCTTAMEPKPVPVRE